MSQTLNNYRVLVLLLICSSDMMHQILMNPQVHQIVPLLRLNLLFINGYTV